MKLRSRWMAIFAVMAAIGAAACSHSASGSAAENNSTPGSAVSAGQNSSAPGALPNGFQSVTDADGTGQLLWTKVAAGQKSATGAMRDSLGALKNYFDGAPQFISAVNDGQDQVVQVMISAKLKGQAVTGVATTVIGSSGGVFGMVVDRPASLKSSFGNLSGKFRAQLPQNGNNGQSFSLAAPVSWTRQTKAGDGSCGVNLPSGWNIRGCTQGTMDIVGPHGEYVALGQIAFVSSMALPGTQGMVSPYLGPVPAFAMYVNWLNGVNRASRVNLVNTMGKVVESKTVQAPMQGGEGAYFLQEMKVNGTPYKIYALVYTARLQLNGWQFYTSYVSAPAQIFDGEFADLMRMWSSWKVDDKVYQQIMQQTLQTMQSTTEMINHATEYQINAQENLQASMLNIINDQTSVADTTNGTVSQVSTADTQKMLDNCKTSGLNCKVVPFNQLASGGH